MAACYCAIRGCTHAAVQHVWQQRADETWGWTHLCGKHGWQALEGYYVREGAGNLRKAKWWERLR